MNGVEMHWGTRPRDVAMNECVPHPCSSHGLHKGNSRKRQWLSVLKLQPHIAFSGERQRLWLLWFSKGVIDDRAICGVVELRKSPQLSSCLLNRVSRSVALTEAAISRVVCLSGRLRNKHWQDLTFQESHGFHQNIQPVPVDTRPCLLPPPDLYVMFQTRRVDFSLYNKPDGFIIISDNGESPTSSER